jgi:hypothetical protein
MKAAKRKFGIGRAGIESRYYLVKGFYESTERTGQDGKPAPMDVLRVSADNINDLMEHLKRFESQFDVYSIRLIGMMRLVSGTPYWG